MKIRTPGIYDAAGRRKYLTRAEGLKFRERAALLHKSEAAFCLTLYFTGCRISEALNLSAAALDPETGDLIVRCLKKRNKEVFRRVPLPDSLIVQWGTLTQSKPEGKLWEFSRTTGWRMIKKLMGDAGILGIHATAKGLRHGFGMRCALAKIPVSMIQSWMGHAHASTTAIYLEARDEEARKLMQRTWE